MPCGFDQYGRPVGLQLVGKPRGEAALLQAASLYERLLGLDRLLPIDPKPGTVPPSTVLILRSTPIGVRLEGWATDVSVCPPFETVATAPSSG